MEWTATKDGLPPRWTAEKNNSIIAVWLDAGELDSIELLNYHGSYYYNLNSNNANHFGGTGEIAMFDLWSLASNLNLPPPK